MKASQSLISILKEAPAEAALASHKLVIRAGLIRANTSGLYTQIPMGLHVLHRAENVVREKMARMGSVELLMPAVQPVELWQEPGRWEFYDKELLCLRDRHGRDFRVGPTCEEAIADTVRKKINSYRQLPKGFYHIQTKFCNEMCPRFGAMHTREFIMKDAYSFHVDYTSLQATYDAVYDAYCHIFTRLGLEFYPAAADTSNIGSTDSHEFRMLMESGEDVIAYGDTSGYAANVELTPTLSFKGEHATAQAELTKVHTPNVEIIDLLAGLLSIPTEETLKSIVVENENEGEIVLLLLCSDHEFSDIKVGKPADVKSPLTTADPTATRTQFGVSGGSLGPTGFISKAYTDSVTEKDADWVIGTNEDDYHYTGPNFGYDAAESGFVGLRNVVEGDESPDGQDRLKLARSIEIGYVFQSRDKYTQVMNVSFLDNNGKSQIMEMGCYDTDITRVIIVAIEQNNDEKGIIWTKAMVPFEVTIVPANYGKPDTVCEAANKTYTGLLAAGADVLFGNCDERTSILLNDSGLLGISRRIVIGDRALKGDNVEYAERRGNKIQAISTDEVAARVLAALK